MGATSTTSPSRPGVLINSSLADFLPIGPPGPLVFEREYHNIAVDAGARGRFHVDVHKYRNNEMNDNPRYETRTAEQECYFPLLRKIRQAAAGDENAEADPKSPIAVIRRTPDEMPQQYYSMADQYEFISKQSLYDVCTGKGSPLEIAQALRLLIRFGMVAADTKSLQDYCDKYLGIDCSEFVCNYANLNLGKKYDKAKTGATWFRDPDSARRSRLLDIQPLDVLAWSGTNHVAIIHSINVSQYAVDTAVSTKTDLALLECTVVESNLSKGLHNSTYHVMSVGANRVFAVERPDGSFHKVYILPLL